jgi:GT2 family glycosyltransferase
MKISFILPTNNTLQYVKQSYLSLREYVDKNNEIIILDDLSTDGTKEWLESLNDNNLKIWYNETNKKLGHTITYDIGVEMAKNDIVMIFHSDMFLVSENTISNMLKHLKEKTVVCATRVEPIGMYPESNEKILINFGGLFPDKYDESFVKNKVLELTKNNINKITKGFFAPWMMYKKDFLEIGGHDKRFAPYPHEDADICYRFALNNYELIQVWDALVCHWCSRGHRRTESNPLKDNKDYNFYENRARREFLRKWKFWMDFDEYRYPKFKNTYDIGFVINNTIQCNKQDLLNIIYHIEPWVNRLGFVDSNEDDIRLQYINYEQPNTVRNLQDVIVPRNVMGNNEITLYIDYNDLIKNINNNIKFITMLSDILTDSGQIGKMKYNDFIIDIKNLNTHQKSLIKN